MKIAVYLGSLYGNDPIYREKVRQLGEWIGRNGHTLVYGGSKVGLMGEVADAALSAGGYVIGVEPQFFIDEVLQHEGVQELISTETIPERRTKMIELSDAFIAFPGGTGTLEEISEIMSMEHLGHTSAPCIIYNLGGYYDSLRDLLSNMVDKGFLPAESMAKIKFASDLDEISDIICS